MAVTGIDPYEQIFPGDSYGIPRQHFAFIITASVLEIIICIILLIDMGAKCMGRKVQAFLIILVFMLEVAIAVDVAIATSHTSIFKDDLIPSFAPFYDDLNTHYKVGLADTVISWVLKVPLLAILTYLAIDSFGSLKI